MLFEYSVDDGNVSKPQFGRARIGGASMNKGSAGDISFSFGSQQLAPTEGTPEERAYQRVKDSAVTKHVFMFRPP